MFFAFQLLLTSGRVVRPIHRVRPCLASSASNHPGVKHETGDFEVVRFQIQRSKDSLLLLKILFSERTNNYVTFFFTTKWLQGAETAAWGSGFAVRLCKLPRGASEVLIYRLHNFSLKSFGLRLTICAGCRASLRPPGKETGEPPLAQRGEGFLEKENIS